MGIVAFIAAGRSTSRSRDPDGFLGPAWVRLPLLVLGAFVVDVVPRSLWRPRGSLGRCPGRGAALIKEHWTRERIALVAIGLTCFYVTYVSYRNLKNGLPSCFHEDTRSTTRAAHDGPVAVVRQRAGAPCCTTCSAAISAHVLAFVYLLFLPMAPISVVVWLVWSRNVTYGYWYVTANCLCWTLGTASYYAIPSLGPDFVPLALPRPRRTPGSPTSGRVVERPLRAVLFEPVRRRRAVRRGLRVAALRDHPCMALVAHYTRPARGPADRLLGLLRA